MHSWFCLHSLPTNKSVVNLSNYNKKVNLSNCNKWFVYRADEIFPWNLSKSSVIKYPSMIITGSVLLSCDQAFMAIANREKRPHPIFLFLQKAVQYNIWGEFYSLFIRFYFVSIFNKRGSSQKQIPQKAIIDFV